MVEKKSPAPATKKAAPKAAPKPAPEAAPKAAAPKVATPKVEIPSVNIPFPAAPKSPGKVAAAVAVTTGAAVLFGHAVISMLRRGR